MGLLNWFNRSILKRADVAGDYSTLDFVVLDTECTGLNVVQDRILSIGAIRLKEGRFKVNEVLEIYVRQEYFGREAVPIHGILKDGTESRITEPDALNMVSQFIGDSIIVGHHIRFDMELLRRAFLRNEMLPLRNLYLDTGKLYRKTLLKTPVLKKKDIYSLDDLVKQFNLSAQDRHTALGDAYLTAIAFLNILEKLNSKGTLSRKKLLDWADSGW
jgi:DNA polymerase-3 subunit epsilon